MTSQVTDGWDDAPQGLPTPPQYTVNEWGYMPEQAAPPPQPMRDNTGSFVYPGPVPPQDDPAARQARRQAEDALFRRVVLSFALIGAAAILILIVAQFV